MRKILFVGFLLFSAVIVNAQVKKQKPIKLQVKTENHRISLEMGNDIFYFTSLDLLNYFKTVKDENLDGASSYLKSYNKEIEYKKDQTIFGNVGERSLYVAIVKHLKPIILSGKVCDVVKDSGKPNLFLLTAKCPSDSSKQNLTEKKGRLVLECL